MAARVRGEVAMKRGISAQMEVDPTRVPTRTETWEWLRHPTADLGRKGGGMTALPERLPQIKDTIHFWRDHVKKDQAEGERAPSVSQQLGAAVDFPSRPQGALVRSSFVDITGAKQNGANGRYYRELGTGDDPLRDPKFDIPRFWKVEMHDPTAKGQWYLLSQVDDRKCIDDCAGRSLGDWFVLQVQASSSVKPSPPNESAVVLYSCSWEEWASPCWRKPARTGKTGLQAQWRSVDEPQQKDAAFRAGFPYQHFFA